MMNHVDAEHIRCLIEANEIEPLPPSVSKAAERYLELNFPLRFETSIVDWSIILSSRLDWMSASDVETVAWASLTIAGSSSLGLLLYSPDEPCVIGPFNYMVSHLDELVWRAPGPRILFGVERDHTGVIVFSQGIIEYNGKGELFASIE